MASVACDRAAAGDVRGGPPAWAGLPEGVERQRRRVVSVVLDVARLALGALVGGLAQRLSGHATGPSLAVLEVEVRDALLRLGAALLEEVGRLRGTGYRGPSYVCPCGVRLALKEVAPLRQRTWCGPVTLERAVYAGAGCRVRAHRVPLDAAWGLLGAAPPPAVPDPDGGVLLPAPPGGGPARLAPAFAALVVEFGARLPYAEAARLLAAALGPVARLAPNTIRAYTRAAGRARREAEAAAPPGARPARAVVLGRGAARGGGCAGGGGAGGRARGGGVGPARRRARPPGAGGGRPPAPARAPVGRGPRTSGAPPVRRAVQLA